MKKREDCKCTCHEGHNLIHFIQCCDGGLLSTTEQQRIWLDKHSDEGYEITAGNPNLFEKKDSENST